MVLSDENVEEIPSGFRAMLLYAAVPWPRYAHGTRVIRVTTINVRGRGGMADSRSINGNNPKTAFGRALKVSGVVPERVESRQNEIENPRDAGATSAFVGVAAE